MQKMEWNGIPFAVYFIIIIYFFYLYAVKALLGQVKKDKKEFRVFVIGMAGEKYIGINFGKI